jgi:heme exporter protein A
VSHEPQLYPHLTMRENLLFAARMCAVPRPAMHVDELLQSHGLNDGANSLSHQLSQGMRKRYSVLRALVHDPCIVLLDEPFVSLDSSGCVWLANVMRTLSRRQRVLCFATHDVDWSNLQPDRVFHLERGALSELAVRRPRSASLSSQPVAA